MDFDERQYLTDPLAGVFRATVRRRETGGDGLVRVWLDRTCFYPASGGQPDDRGTLGGHRVRGVIEDAGGVCHLVEEAPAGAAAVEGARHEGAAVEGARHEGTPVEAERQEGALVEGATVEGRIDMARRLDHMQQHTGQHLLSRVLAREAGRATVGFHLGERGSTIDLDGEVDEATLERVEVLVNELVMRDIPVAQRVLARAEYEAAPGADEVRSRLPGDVERVRIVEIEGVDRSTCCGTHCLATGMVGPVKILSAESVRGGTRVEFVCGLRAVRDASEKHALLRRLALMFSTDWRELPAVVAGLVAENKALRKERDGLVREIAALRAEKLDAATGTIGAYRLVRTVLEREDASRAREVVSRLREQADTIVLFAIAAPRPALLFACTPGLPLDMGSVMRAAAAAMGGRGGGGADFAQGGGGDPDRITAALDTAERLLGEAVG